MKNTLFTVLLLTFTLFTYCQNPVLTFDGIDDYIDLGIDAGNGVRTVEMWFKLDEEITPQLNEFVTLAAKEISGTNNTNEFSFSFQHASVPNSGKLRFDIDGTLPFKSVYSDNDTWNANQWYHVAAVIDSIDGMMLFIDGVKQISTHPHTEATSTTSSITTIGCWGKRFDRFFKGSIDDVRFSSQALYNSNFEPSCPDAIAMNNTIGLWNFNEGSGNTATDASANNFDGQLVGPSWDISNICGNVVSFDGINDYIDLGIDAGNGVRTVEMWFKLDEEITPQLNEFVTLAAREISGTNNTNEFSFSFQHASVPNSGKLRFDIDGTLPFKSVYSDNDTWNANQWYHVAAVIDSIDGMMLFIDGVKQISTHPHTEATSTITNITTIGCWGNRFDRYFKGSIDDVRFSSQALYNSNFEPSCPDAIAMNNTIGLWNFNERSGNTATDASANNFDGQLVGATRIFSNICQDSIDTSTPQQNGINKILSTIYPNPSDGIFHFIFDNFESYNFDLNIYNAIGQLIKSEKVVENIFLLDMSNESNGIYYYQITDKNKLVSGKILKQ